MPCAISAFRCKAMFYFLEETTSTNDDARDRRYVEGDIICAERQTAGRGQRGHKWSSGEGLDLTFSLVLEPTFVAVDEQFSILQITALALVATLADYGIAASIKWTNDIYVGDRKITGVLIEHNVSGAYLSRTIIGIGININRTEFDPSLPNPTSMKAETGRTFDRREVLEHFHGKIMRLYASLHAGEVRRLQNRYAEYLYRRDELHTYALPDGSRFEGVIRGTEPSGRLVVEHSDGHTETYAFKEIEYVLKK